MTKIEANVPDYLAKQAFAVAEREKVPVDLDGPIPAKCIIVFALHSLAIPTVAFDAELAEDFATLLVLFRARQSLLAQQKTQQRHPGEALNSSNAHHGHN